mgnify:CR=1 FL=1
MLKTPVESSFVAVLLNIKNLQTVFGKVNYVFGNGFGEIFGRFYYAKEKLQRSMYEEKFEQVQGCVQNIHATSSSLR